MPVLQVVLPLITPKVRDSVDDEYAITFRVPRDDSIVHGNTIPSECAKAFISSATSNAGYNYWEPFRFASPDS